MQTVNFTIEESVWELLQGIPKSKRNKLVNDAIREAIERKERATAVRKLDMWKKRLKPVTDDQILKMLREDRKRYKR